MPGPKPVSKEDLASIYTGLHKRGTGILQTKGLTEEEECRAMWKTFQDIYDMGYEYIHTLRVVPADGRKPYYVHVDDVYRS